MALSNWLEEKRIPVTFPGDVQAIIPLNFVPWTVLQHVTKSMVTDELFPNFASHNRDERLINFVVKNAPQLFVICMYSDIRHADLRRAMNIFNEWNINDKHIPISPEKVRQIWTNPKNWQIFLTSQAIFPLRIPTTPRLSRIDMAPTRLFPIEASSSIPHRGGFGKVWKVIFHASYLLPEVRRNQPGYTAALKQISLSELDDGAKTWEREAEAIEKLSGRGVPHLIQTNAMIRRGDDGYFIFPWAEGGNLLNFWGKYGSLECRQYLARHSVPTIIEQLTGLASALKYMHNFGQNSRQGVTREAFYRHGDLKPENILIFGTQQLTIPECGTWTMADLGLARFHEQATRARQKLGLWAATSTAGWGTISYQPPETYWQLNEDSGRFQATSRLYDIWSMGCIILQLVAWLVYGHEMIARLNQNTKQVLLPQKGSAYWSPVFNPGTNTVSRFSVHEEVKALIRQLKQDVQTSGVLLALLVLVEDKLLVVDLPLDPRRTKSGQRTNADDLHASLESIRKSCYSGNGYCANIQSLIAHPQDARIPRVTRSLHAVARFRLRNARDGVSNDKIDQRDMNQTWIFKPDNDFAETLRQHSEFFTVLASDTGQMAKLCEWCKGVDVQTRRFEVVDDYDYLRQHANVCDFCKIRWEAIEDSSRFHGRPIYFDQVDSNVRLNGRDPPVLTVLRGPDVNPDDAYLHDVQIGPHRLPKAGTMAHFEVIRHWLLDCDENHANCQPSKSTRPAVPTRLIDVGSKGSPVVKLYETNIEDELEYLALSHPWGPQSASHFCTFRRNVDRHIEGIGFDELPATFQDAVRVTRALGHRYLWIDSICIIQGPDGDFNEEAKRMEDVFSQAYCVLAATSARGQHDGFLGPRDERKYLTIRQDPLPPMYICEFIDNFQQHVVDSHLNQRGWVLQERVLARRTIYFTSKQTYWECGGGVRCETITKMDNKLASFLGDPHFPEVAIQSNQGGKIRLYQSLYGQYSRLKFSHYTDRPVAIAGLEKRLISSLGLRGGFGMLDDDGPGLLRRSLLWCRAGDVHRLDLINFDDGNGLASKPSPPTWSWMAYKGAIDYLTLPFNQVEWETEDVISPWETNALGTWSYSRDHSAKRQGLRVIARQFDAAAADAAATDGTANFIIDTPSSTQPPGPACKCVVMGRLKDESEEARDDRTHFVMLVKPMGPDASPHTYLRAGVGFMPGNVIRFGETGVVGHVL